MSLEKVIENWTDYDNKKIRDRRDAKDFACSESWEVDYLVKKISEIYPRFSESLIRAAITECCRQIKTPHPRKEFVSCVLKRLGAI